MMRCAVRTSLVFALAAATSAAQSTWYVDDDATSGGDGTNWSNAFEFLQDALAVAQPGDEVRVAGGRYQPDQGTGFAAGDRDAEFEVGGIQVVGGFRGLAGGGAEDERDFALFPSILTGDLAHDDPSLADNSKLLVRLDGDAVLDGLILEATSAAPFDSKGVDASGHALTARDCEFRAHEGSAAQFGTFTLERCRFHHNRYAVAGADIVAIDCTFEDHPLQAVDLFHRSLHATRCAFRRNATDDLGGAILGYEADVTLDDCIVEDNSSTGSAWEGGGAITLFDGGSLRLHDCRFSRNSCLDAGGAIYVFSPDDTIAIEMKGCLFEENHSEAGSGAIHLDADDPATLEDCRFVRNSAKYGGGAGGGCLGSVVRCAFLGNTSTFGGGGLGAYTVGADLSIVDSTFEGNDGVQISAFGVTLAAGDVVRIERCTFADNHAAASIGAAVVSTTNSVSSLRVVDSILFDNDRAGIDDEAAQIAAPPGAITIDRCCLEGWTGALGGSGNFGSDPLFVDPVSGRYDLQLASPCVEAGDPGYVPAAGFERDVAGNCRVLDAQLDRTPALDLGAHEFAHARLSWSGNATPGGTVTIALDGTAALPTLMLLGAAETAVPFRPHGFLFVDVTSPFLLVPWPSAPSSLDLDVPSDFPTPTAVFLQAFVFRGRAGNLSNLLELDVR
jgi:hypothetical protein